MRPYQGPATVVVDGAEHAVTASLWSTKGSKSVHVDRRSGSVKAVDEWGGLLKVDNDAAARAIMRTVHDLVLRLPDGGHSTFEVIRGEGGSIEIKGTGPSPY